MVLHGDLQANVIEQRRTELVRQIVQVVGELHDLVPNHRELSGDRLRWGDRGSFHVLQIDGQSCESLIEVVMQFARDPLALLFLARVLEGTVFLVVFCAAATECFSSA